MSTYTIDVAPRRNAIRRLLSVPALLALVSGAACVPPSSPPPAPPAESPSNANSARPTAEPQAQDRGARAPVTLAVLDALLYDPAFVEDLRAKLGLSAGEIERLKRVASDARATLGEEEDPGAERSTVDAERVAVQQLDAAVGPEKASRVLGFARERWAGGQTPQKPGTVPADTRVVVNTPAYRLDVFEGGRLVKTYTVGIGYPEFPLPDGLRSAEEIVLNPTWTPPDEPWVKGKVTPGERIEANDPRNPLGPIKIPIGLPSLIHGGKSPSKLGDFASHGCVGMTTPQVEEFAVLLARLGGIADPETEIAALRKGGDTTTLRLDRPVPVELRYETITVEDGKLLVHRDVYERRTNTEAQLRAVLETYGVSLADLSELERAQALEALDAMSRPVTNRSPSSSNAARKASSERPGASGRVTPSVRGEKERVVEIAALAGKGYPSPVDVGDGASGKRAASKGVRTGSRERRPGGGT